MRMHSFLLEKSLPAFGFNAIQHLSGIRYTVYGKPVVNQSDLHQSLGSTRAYAEPASLTGSFSKNLRFLSSDSSAVFAKNWRRRTDHKHHQTESWRVSFLRLALAGALQPTRVARRTADIMGHDETSWDTVTTDVSAQHSMFLIPCGLS